jgi:hypothetical protein
MIIVLAQLGNQWRWNAVKMRLLVKNCMALNALYGRFGELDWIDGQDLIGQGEISQ